MRKNILEEPGANSDQLFELAINLANARTFAGKSNGVDDWDWREGDWTDPDDEDLYDWEPKPKLKAQGTYGKYAQQIASGGRVGLKDGTTTGMAFPKPLPEGAEEWWSTLSDKQKSKYKWNIKDKTLGEIWEASY